MSQTPRRQKVKRSNSDALILEAASSLLSKRSNVDVSVSEIAQASGLNSALISYHFGSKEGMLLALVKRDATVALAQLDRLVKMDLSPEEKIRHHVVGVINTYAKYPYLNRLLHLLLESSDREMARELAEFFIEPLIEAEQTIIEEGVKLGRFRRVDPMYFYLPVIGACDILFYGKASLEFVFNVPEVTAAIRDRYANVVVDSALKMLSVDPAAQTAPENPGSHATVASLS